jgi:hypothetical protein
VGPLLSGAAYTAGSPKLSITVSSGTLDLQSTRDGQAIVTSAGNMRPGDSRSGEVTLHNSGSVAGNLAFAVEGPPVDQPPTPPLSGTVRLKLERCSAAGQGCPNAQLILPVPPDDPSLADLTTRQPQALGSIAPGADQTYRVTLLWPASATNPALQGASTSVTLSFTATAGS